MNFIKVYSPEQQKVLLKGGFNLEDRDLSVKEVDEIFHDFIIGKYDFTDDEVEMLTDVIYENSEYEDYNGEDEEDEKKKNKD